MFYYLFLFAGDLLYSWILCSCGSRICWFCWVCRFCWCLLIFLDVDFCGCLFDLLVSLNCLICWFCWFLLIGCFFSLKFADFDDLAVFADYLFICWCLMIFVLICWFCSLFWFADFADFCWFAFFFVEFADFDVFCWFVYCVECADFDDFADFADFYWFADFCWFLFCFSILLIVLICWFCWCLLIGCFCSRWRLIILLSLHWEHAGLCWFADLQILMILLLCWFECFVYWFCWFDSSMRCSILFPIVLIVILFACWCAAQVCSPRCYVAATRRSKILILRNFASVLICTGNTAYFSKPQTRNSPMHLKIRA